MELLTIGYARWNAENRWSKLVAALRAASVQVVVDVRHSPCSSNLDPSHQYGPRNWNLQAGEAGIGRLLQSAGIEYLWLVELGNPQKNDPEMRVLREHLGNPSAPWPVHRGLAQLTKLVVEARRRCCLMCTCKDFDTCHRKLVAEAFQKSVAPLTLAVRDLSTV